MNVSLGGRLGAALACVLLFAFSAAAAAADQSAASTERLRQLAARIYTTTRTTEQAHAAREPVTDRDLRAATDTRKQFDALARDATIRGFAADATFARKAAQVGMLLANLERAQKAGPDANVPLLIPHAPAADHVAHVRLGAHNGANCTSAITIGAGYAIATTLAASGADGSTLWLRIAPDRNGFYRLDTAALPLDTEITLFGASCPASDVDAIARNDDAFGLAAAVTVDVLRNPGFHYYARVRNLGGAGDVLAEVESAGAITGRIVDERNGQPLAASVQILTADGYYVASEYSGGDGFYLVSLDPGSYYVLGGPGFFYGSFVPELYPDIPCADYFGGDLCPTQGAELLTLGDGQEISGIDFALNIGGQISGVVREADSGNPLAGARVLLLNSSGNALYSTSTDIAGRYVVAGLLTQEYFVEADADGHGSQRWDHVTCGGAVQTECQPQDGTPLAMVRNQQMSGVDFDLPREASVHAVATTFGAPDVRIQYWQFNVYDLTGTLVTVGYANGDDGAYSGPLPPGSYRIAASAYGYFGQVWDGIDCPTDCLAQLPTGAVVTLDRGQQAEIAFALRPAPVVSGRITDTAQHPLEGVNVGLIPVDSPFGTINSTTTRADGSYELTGTPTGEYYVWAFSTAYRGTVYPSGACTNLNGACDLSGATSITIAYGSPDRTDIDIAMPANGSISGHFELRTPAGMLLPAIDPGFETVSIVDGNNNYIAGAYATTTGDYTVPGIAAGTYYATTSGDAFGQVWHGIDCGWNCNALGGSPIVVAQGQNVTGIDFDPIPIGYIFGRVTDGNGAPLGGVAIDLWNGSDATHCGVGVTNGDGYYAASAQGRPCYDAYRVSTDAGSSGYENQVFDDIPCPEGPAYLGLCSLDDATLLPIPETPVFVIANFALIPRPDAIYSSGFDP